MAVFYPSESITLQSASNLQFGIGGAETNLAITLSNLGHTTSFISRVGADPFGQRIRDTLTQHGVATSYLQTDPQHSTGIFFREWLPDGKRRVFYYRRSSAASMLSAEDLRIEMFAQARVVHLTGITPALGPECARAVERAFELARSANAIISFDPNYRAALWQPDEAQRVLWPFLKQADILLMGHEDAQAILAVPEEEFEAVIRKEFPTQTVILKLAERGAKAFTPEQILFVPARPVASVIDPVGAGDAFNAGFLAGFLRNYSLEQSLQMGAWLGAQVVESLGDYIADCPVLPDELVIQ
jgi:2-dehydro-3-deoxygluconokinase